MKNCTPSFPPSGSNLRCLTYFCLYLLYCPLRVWWELSFRRSPRFAWSCVFPNFNSLSVRARKSEIKIHNNFEKPELNLVLGSRRLCQHRVHHKEPNRSCLSGSVFQHSSLSQDHRRCVPIRKKWFKVNLRQPVFYFCPVLETKEHSYIFFWLVPYISQSDTLLGRVHSSSSDGREVVQNFFCWSFSSRYSSHNFQDQTLCIVRVCECKPWTYLDRFSQSCCSSLNQNLFHTGLDQAEGRVHSPVLLL